LIRQRGKFGLAAAWAGSRYLESMLFEVKARDLTNFAAVFGFLIAVSLVAAWQPSRRAARVDRSRTQYQEFCASTIPAGVDLAPGLALAWGLLVLGAVDIAAFRLPDLITLPLILAGKMTGFNWGEITVNFALVAGGWVVAESYRGIPWLARGKLGNK